jgi:hypothetical protein
MNIKITSYCRLEFFCFLGIDKIGISKKEKCLLSQDFLEYINNEDYDVYAEDYDDISSVISRISEIGNEYDIKYHLEYPDYWNEPIDPNGDEQEIGAASVMLYNQWGKYIIVAVLFDKWMIPSHTYESYENYKHRNNDIISVVLQTPEYSMFSEKQFMSNKIASLMIKEWLETNDIDTELYYQ